MLMRELIFLMNDMDDHVPAEPSFVVLFIIKFNKMNKKKLICSPINKLTCCEFNKMNRTLMFRPIYKFMHC